MSRLAQSIYMALGSSGAMVDVTSYMDLEEGLERRWGRESEFEDTRPGEFSFTLDNMDGRFTPGNTTAATAAGYASTLTEGMVVCHQLGGSRLVRGTVQAIEPVFPGNDSAWAQVRVTCDDMLGNAARAEFSDDPAYDLFLNASPLLRWSFEDSAGAGYALESERGAHFPYATGGTDGQVFGATDSLIPASSVWKFSPTLVGSGGFTSPTFPTLTYGTASEGVWSFWLQMSTDSTMTLSFQAAGAPASNAWTLTVTAGNPGFRLLVGGGASVTTPFVPNVPHFVEITSSTIFSAGAWNISWTLYVDGVSIGAAARSGAAITSLTDAERTPSVFNISFTDSGPNNKYHLSHMTHSLSRVREYELFGTTEASVITGVASLVPEITIDTLPAALSTAPLSSQELSGSALDVLNDVVRTEQGQMYPVTTGTLSAPVEKIKFRERSRPSAVTASFNAETEASDAVDFIRDLTNLAYRVTADGPTNSATYTNSALSSRAGSKNVSESVLLRDVVDLYTYATDRSLRGANTGLRCAALTIDAMVTPTDRSSDLLALVPGNRYRVTGLPSTQLGFSTWDGWLLGAVENHTLTEHTFTLYLSPVLTAAGIYNTSTFDNAVFGF